MDPITLGLIFGGVGAGKSLLFDSAKEKRQRKLAAETARMSPWTGIKDGPMYNIEEADPIGEGMAFGMTGVGLGQNMQAHKAKMGQMNAGQMAQLDQQIEQMPSAEEEFVQPEFGSQFSRKQNPWGYVRRG